MLLRRTAVPLLCLGLVHALVLRAVSNSLEVQENGKNDLLPLQAWLAVIVSAICLIWLSWDYVSILMKLEYPGPIPLPFLGNALDMMAGVNIQDSVDKILKRYGPHVQLVIPKNRIMMLSSDAVVNKIVLTKSTDRGAVESSKNSFQQHFCWVQLFAKNQLDMFLLSGPTWKARRKLVQPAFDQKHVRAMMYPISDILHELLDVISTKLQHSTTVSDKDKDNNNGNTNGILDVLPLFRIFGLQVLCKTSLGLSLDLLQNPEKGQWIIDTFSESSAFFSQYLFDPFLYFRVKVLPEWGWNQPEIRRREHMIRLRTFVTELVDKEKEKQQKDQQTNKHEQKDDDGQDNLLSLLVRASLNHPNEFSDSNVVDELRSLMFGGFDTTATTVSILLYYIAANPHVQERLYEEINQAIVAQKKESSKTQHAVNFAQVILKSHYSLPYLTACIRESQRINSVAPINERRLEHNVTVETLDGQKLKFNAGQRFLIPMFHMHANPTQYPNPNCFDPDRWIETSNNKNDSSSAPTLKPIPNGYFYAFGGGPKMCVAFQFAEKLVKMTALGILSKFQIENTQVMVIRDSLNAGPGNMPLKLTPRKQTT